MRQAYRLSVGLNPEQLKDQIYVRMFAALLHHEAMVMRNMRIQAQQVDDTGIRLGEHGRVALMLATRRIVEDMHLIKSAMADLLDINFNYEPPPVEVMEEVYKMFTTAEIENDDT